MRQVREYRIGDKCIARHAFGGVRGRRRRDCLQELANLHLVFRQKQKIENRLPPTRPSGMRRHKRESFGRGALHQMARGEKFLKRQVQEADIARRFVDEQPGSFFRE